jgi:hypothetical protein
MATGPSWRKIRGGSQTGADQAGLRAAKAAGIETGGGVPKGCRLATGDLR